jgi:hypothetical protein
MRKPSLITIGVVALCAAAVAACTSTPESPRSTNAAKARAPAAAGPDWTSPTGRLTLAYAREGWKGTTRRPPNDGSPGTDRAALDLMPADGDERAACLLEERTHTAPAAVDQATINTMTRDVGLMNMQRSVGPDFTLQSSNVIEMNGVTVARGRFRTQNPGADVAVVDLINVSIALGGPNVRVVIASCGAAPNASGAQVQAMGRILDTLSVR